MSKFQMTKIYLYEGMSLIVSSSILGTVFVPIDPRTRFGSPEPVESSLFLASFRMTIAIGIDQADFGHEASLLENSGNR